MRQGMCNRTGGIIRGVPYLQQRLGDVLTTRISQRTARRPYGSRVPELVDAPLNQDTIIELYTAVNEAVEDPINGLEDFRLTSVSVEEVSSGQLSLHIEGELDGQSITTEIEI